MEYADDVYARVFAKTEAGREDLTAAEKHLQELYVRYITSYTEDLVAKTTGRSALTIAELTGLAKAGEPVRTEGMSDEEFIALLPKLRGSHICSLDHDHSDDPLTKLDAVGYLNFGNSYGEPADLFTSAINMTGDLYLPLQYRAEELLKKALASTKSESLRMHYQTLLRKLEKITK